MRINDHIRISKSPPQIQHILNLVLEYTAYSCMVKVMVLEYTLQYQI